MIKTTAVHDITLERFAMTAAPVATLNTDRTEYYWGPTVGDNKTNIFLFTVINNV